MGHGVQLPLQYIVTLQVHSKALHTQWSPLSDQSANMLTLYASGESGHWNMRMYELEFSLPWCPHVHSHLTKFRTILQIMLLYYAFILVVCLLLNRPRRCNNPFQHQKYNLVTLRRHCSIITDSPTFSFEFRFTEKYHRWKNYKIIRQHNTASIMYQSEIYTCMQHSKETRFHRTMSLNGCTIWSKDWNTWNLHFTKKLNTKANIVKLQYYNM